MIRANALPVRSPELEKFGSAIKDREIIHQTGVDVEQELDRASLKVLELRLRVSGMRSRNNLMDGLVAVVERVTMPFLWILHTIANEAQTFTLQDRFVLGNYTAIKKWVDSLSCSGPLVDMSQDYAGVAAYDLVRDRKERPFISNSRSLVDNLICYAGAVENDPCLMSHAQSCVFPIPSQGRQLED